LLRPGIIALSGLLTISYDVMRETVALVRGVPDASLSRTPVIVGGGMLNAQVCSYVGADFWAIDAMVGVRLCTQIVAADGNTTANGGIRFHNAPLDPYH
jgi:5-methyltetrahydrofolate--homocysteine methyltransferase